MRSGSIAKKVLSLNELIRMRIFREILKETAKFATQLRLRVETLDNASSH